MKTEFMNVKMQMLAIALMAVLTLSLVSAFPIVTAQSEDNKEDENEENVGDSVNDKGKHNGKDKEKMKDKGKDEAKGKDKDKNAKAHAEGKQGSNHADKKSMAVATIKIALTSPNTDTNSHSFGSAKLMLKIQTDKEPVLRANINVVAEEKPTGTLTVCLDGKPIGELTTPGSEEKSKLTGHLKATVKNPSIQLPGVNVAIVEGTCDSGTTMLSGSI